MGSLKQRLQEDKEKVAKSLAAYREQLAYATRQVDVHQGHLERIDMMLAFLAEGEEPAEAEQADE